MRVFAAKSSGSGIPSRKAVATRSGRWRAHAGHKSRPLSNRVLKKLTLSVMSDQVLSLLCTASGALAK